MCLMCLMCLMILMFCFICDTVFTLQTTGVALVYLSSVCASMFVSVELYMYMWVAMCG